jgi:hypothetical protein
VPYASMARTNANGSMLRLRLRARFYGIEGSFADVEVARVIQVRR